MQAGALRLVLTLCVVGVALFAVPAAQANHQFTDVDENHQFHSEIGVFKDTNITSGCTATTFCPQDFVRRQAMAAFVTRALGLVERPGETGLVAVPGSRIAMIDDGLSHVRTESGALRLSYDGDLGLRITPEGPIGGSFTNVITAGVNAGAIGGGGDAFGNRVTDDFAFVGGGRGNLAGNDTGTFADASIATVGGGESNRAGGRYSTVPGGRGNRADGQYSFAAGHRARALHSGAFVWADGTDADFDSQAADQFSVRAGGGVRLLGDTSVGGNGIVFAGRAGKSLVVWGPLLVGGDNATACNVIIADDVCFFDEQNGALAVKTANGANYAPVRANQFITVSTAKAKKDITRLGSRSAEDLRRLLEGLPLYRFRYRNESAARRPHTGVIAERAPRLILSPDGKGVNLYDYIGVTAGATKAVSRQVRKLERENRALKRQVERQDARLAALERRLAALPSAR